MAVNDLFIQSGFVLMTVEFGVRASRPRHASWSEDEQTLKETAYHEAGHAVIAKLSGTYLVGAIDARPESTQGACDCTFVPALHEARQLALGLSVDAKAEEAVICAAGAAAQIRFMADSKIGLDSDGGWTDAADTYVFHCASGDVERVRELFGVGRWCAAMACAKAFLNEAPVWEAISRLATEVIRRGGEMSETAVDSFLHQTFVELDLPEFQALA